MKKCILCFLCVLLMLGCLPAFSANVATVTTTADVAALKPGDSVTFTVRVAGVNAKSMALKLGTGFDSRVFSFVSGRWLVEGLLVDVDTAKLNAVIGFSKAQDVSGAVFSFTLQVKESAPAGDTRVAVTAVVDSGAAVEPVGCTLTVAGTQPPTAGVTTTVGTPVSTTSVVSTGEVRPTGSEDVAGDKTQATATAGTAADTTAAVGNVTTADGTASPSVIPSTVTEGEGADLPSTTTDSSDFVEAETDPELEQSDRWLWVTVGLVAAGALVVAGSLFLLRKRK